MKFRRRFFVKLLAVAVGFLFAVPLMLYYLDENQNKWKQQQLMQRLWAKVRAIVMWYLFIYFCLTNVVIFLLYWVRLKWERGKRAKEECLFFTPENHVKKNLLTRQNLKIRTKSVLLLLSNLKIAVVLNLICVGVSELFGEFFFFFNIYFIFYLVQKKFRLFCLCKKTKTKNNNNI